MVRNIIIKLLRESDSDNPDPYALLFTNYQGNIDHKFQHINMNIDYYRFSSDEHRIILTFTTNPSDDMLYKISYENDSYEATIRSRSVHKLYPVLMKIISQIDKANILSADDIRIIRIIEKSGVTDSSMRWSKPNNYETI